MTPCRERHACCFATGRELYDKLHGFDPHMFVWGVEDVDLALRCWLMGHPILHDPEPCISHRFRRTFDNYEVPIRKPSQRRGQAPS